MSNYVTVQKAITNKQQIYAVYNGYKRQLCPHQIGSIKGVAHGFFYQFAGEDESGIARETELNWRCFPLDEMREVMYIEGSFYPKGKFVMPPSGLDKVEVSIPA
ncbi:MAG: hypothetical protein ACHQRM_06740 [Bacteroidia bacterium]